MKSLIRKVGRGQKGFTLIEVLVVVAILGVLAAVAVPAVSSFIGEGDESAAETELRDVQTALTAAMAAAGSGTCEAVAVATADMDTLGVDGNDDGDLLDVGVDFLVSDYMTGLNADGTVKSGNTYTCTADGVVSQS